MKFATLLTTALSATVALAAPSKGTRRDRLSKRIARRESARSGNPMFAVNTTEPAIKVESYDAATHPEYSSNWAGAVLIGTGYKKVTGTFIVPTPSVPSGGSSRTTYASSAWVGIDGDTCGTAILQTGVDFEVQGSTTYYDAWYEWYPDYAYDFSGISISAGDSITVTVTASSTSAGTATITNNSKGTTVTHSFSGESNKLCEYNAEWIVEDFESGGSLVPFADFGSVTFTGASASTSSGSVGPSGATIIDIEQNGVVLTSVSTTSSSVTVTYV